MLEKIHNLILKLADSYIIVLFIAIGLGLLLPDVFVRVTDRLTLLLAVIFFFNSLRIKLADVKHDIKDWRMIIIGTSWMLIGLPLVTYPVVRMIYPDLALPFLLLAAMPAGTTLPLLVEIIGGRASLALVFTVASSMLAPITVPLMIRLLAGAEVEVDVYSMFRSLVIVVVVPFIAAQIVRKIAEKNINKIGPYAKSLVVLLLGLLIAGVIAKQANGIEGQRVGPFIGYLVGLVGLFTFFAVSGWAIAWKKTPKEQLTMAMNVTCINFTLAIFLAGKFFPQPNVVLPVVLSVLPWSLFVIPFKIIAAKIDLEDDPNDKRHWLHRIIVKLKK